MSRIAAILLMLVIGTPTPLLTAVSGDRHRPVADPASAERIEEVSEHTEAKYKGTPVFLVHSPATATILSWLTERADCGGVVSPLTQDCASHFCRPPPSTNC